MQLSPEQKQAVASWIATGDNLSAIQKKLSEQFQISLTYMEVRFLVDDLGLELKNPVAPEPKAGANPTLGEDKPAGKKAGLFDKLKKAVGAGGDEPSPAGPGAMGDEDIPAEDLEPMGGGKVAVELDLVTRPGTVVSGTVVFSDGTKGKWALDQQGRLMLDTGKPGYQPVPEDIQGFQQELSLLLQKRGY
jgi:hypothetical protein